MAQQGGQLELPPLEPDRETPGDRQEANASPTRGGGQTSELPAEGDDWRHSPEIRCLQDPCLPGKTGGSGRDLPLRDLFARFPGARGVRSPGPPHRLLVNKPHRGLDETRHPSSLHDGEEARGSGLPSSHASAPLAAAPTAAAASTASPPALNPPSSLKPDPHPSGPHGVISTQAAYPALPVIRLQGGLNSCYLNSFLYNLVAAASASRCHSILPQVFWEQSGQAHRAQRLMGFRLLGWSAPEQQHDVAELIDFLHGRLASSLVRATCEVRSHTAEGLQHVVQAPATKCLALPVNPGMHSPDVQDLIQAWHATQQAGVAAYTEAPAWLFLQYPDSITTLPIGQSNCNMLTSFPKPLTYLHLPPREISA